MNTRPIHLDHPAGRGRPVSSPHPCPTTPPATLAPGAETVATATRAGTAAPTRSGSPPCPATPAGGGPATAPPGAATARPRRPGWAGRGAMLAGCVALATVTLWLAGPGRGLAGLELLRGWVALARAINTSFVEHPGADPGAVRARLGGLLAQGGESGGVSLQTFLINTRNFLLTLSKAVTGCAMAFGGIRMAWSHGNTEAYEKGKRALQAGAGGFVIAWLADAIVNTLGSLVGGGGG